MKAPEFVLTDGERVAIEALSLRTRLDSDSDGVVMWLRGLVGAAYDRQLPK